MLTTGLLLKGFTSILLSLQVATSATAPTIEIHTVYSPNYANTVSDKLPWSESLRAGAELKIDAQVKALEILLQTYRDEGATRLEIRPAKDLSYANEQKALGSLKRFKFFAYDGKKVIAESAESIPDFMDYGSYLIRPAGTSCSLAQWSLFSPATWFAERCRIITPTAEKYLNYSLRAFLNYSNPRDGVTYLEGALKEMSQAHRPFEIINGQIRANFLGSNGQLSAIPLENLSALGGYTILVNSSKTKITFIELPPNLRKLASRGKYDQKDHTFTFLVP